MDYEIVPLGKPRMTQRDRWAKRPAVMRYRAFCDLVRANHVDIRPAGNDITFVLPMPKSWSKKKKASMEGRPHQQTPDIDNILKALLDAVHEDDAHIWQISARKIWGVTGKITVEVKE